MKQLYQFIRFYKAKTCIIFNLLFLSAKIRSIFLIFISLVILKFNNDLTFLEVDRLLDSKDKDGSLRLWTKTDKVHITQLRKFMEFSYGNWAGTGINEQYLDLDLRVFLKNDPMIERFPILWNEQVERLELLYRMDPEQEFFFLGLENNINSFWSAQKLRVHGVIYVHYQDLGIRVFVLTTPWVKLS